MYEYERHSIRERHASHPSVCLQVCLPPICLSTSLSPTRLSVYKSISRPSVCLRVYHVHSYAFPKGVSTKIVSQVFSPIFQRFSHV